MIVRAAARCNEPARCEATAEPRSAQFNSLSAGGRHGVERREHDHRQTPMIVGALSDISYAAFAAALAPVAARVG